MSPATQAHSRVADGLLALAIAEDRLLIPFFCQGQGYILNDLLTKEVVWLLYGLVAFQEPVCMNCLETGKGPCQERIGGIDMWRKGRDSREESWEGL